MSRTGKNALRGYLSGKRGMWQIPFISHKDIARITSTLK